MDEALVSVIDGAVAVALVPRRPFAPVIRLWHDAKEDIPPEAVKPAQVTGCSICFARCGCTGIRAELRAATTQQKQHSMPVSTHNAAWGASEDLFAVGLNTPGDLVTNGSSYTAYEPCICLNMCDGTEGLTAVWRRWLPCM